MSVSGRRIPPAFLNVWKRVSLVFVSIVVLASVIVIAAPSHQANAAQITERKLTLMSGAGNDGGSKPSGVVNHNFTFTLGAHADIGSIKFLYCTTASDPVGNNEVCATPSGLSTSSPAATLGASSGTVTFTTITNSNAASNVHSVVGRASALSSYAGGAVTVQLNGITNPSTANQTFFVRIFTYASTDGSGTPIDSGSVAASTANPIVLNGTMPESLVFCTGGTINVNASGQPVCSTATNSAINFNQLFSPQATAWAISQLAASTNADDGYVITVAGPTMTSGSNTIAAIGGTGTASAQGTAQFGMNLVDDAFDPHIGTTSPTPVNYYADPAGSPDNGNVYPAANGTNYRGQAKAPFADPGTDPSTDPPTYAFTAGSANIVAASDFNTAGPTDGQRFTATYIVNVPGSQPAGNYTSTLTYICTPAF